MAKSLVFKCTFFTKVGVILLFVLVNVIVYTGLPRLAFVVASIASGIAILLLFSITYRIQDDKLSKYFFAFKWVEIPIGDIELVEFYSRRDMDAINVSSREEAKYRLLLKSRNVITFSSSHRHKNKTVGEYLCKRYKIKKRVTKIVISPLGNPRDEGDGE
ncbi:hypothetical protein [Gorillibacterium sp. CAU 1737]|uniref:hypothetical protein n=1 Tax=Gorillibacterium sp. CAU 1737 TaxID=3140362 RepID=UPI0032610A6B